MGDKNAPGALLVAQLVRDLPVVRFLGQEDPLEKGYTTTPVILNFPGGSGGKESACDEGDLGSVPGLGTSPGEGHGSQLQILAWKIPMGRKAWWATVAWCLKESDVTERHSTAQKCSRRKFNLYHFPIVNKRKGINIY